MNAKFGKISLACFVVFWVLVGILALLRASSTSDAIIALVVWTYNLMGLSLLLGFIFLCIGAIKGENPKGFCAIGHVLNFCALCVCFLGIMARGCFGGE